MANHEHLMILMQGMPIWNQFRQDRETLEIDLSNANLFAANLRLANLSKVNLSGARLKEANLREADLRGADLRDANLSGSDLRETDLREANLSGVNLNNRNNLSGATLGFTNLSRITDLHTVIGLENIFHFGLSFLDTHTLKSARGQFPDVFLRGCGLSDLEIEFSKLHNPDLTNEQILNFQYRMYDLRATRALQISPLFISYSHADTRFVDKLDKVLVEKGIRFWRDIHDMTSGRMETQIDHAIRQNPTVLLVLSRNSLNSDWVQHEVRKARELEKDLGRDTLCPVALDDSWKSAPWPARIMEQIMEYNILDFSGWEDKSALQSKFSKLLSGLDLFYKKPEA